MRKTLTFLLLAVETWEKFVLLWRAPPFKFCTRKMHEKVEWKHAFVWPMVSTFWMSPSKKHVFEAILNLNLTIHSLYIINVTTEHFMDLLEKFLVKKLISFLNSCNQTKSLKRLPTFINICPASETTSISNVDIRLEVHLNDPTAHPLIEMCAKYIEFTYYWVIKSPLPRVNTQLVLIVLHFCRHKKNELIIR